MDYVIAQLRFNLRICVIHKPESRSDDTLRMRFINQAVNKVSSLRDLEGIAVSHPRPQVETGG